MWIVPKQLISASALDTEALISDSSEFSQVAEQSLMWRSKPSQSRTWSQRWKRETWMRHLSGRTLRHSKQNRFAAWWTSSLAATRANRSRQQVADSAQKTHDTSGRFCAEQYELFSPEESFSKTSKDTSRLDSPQSSATWKKIVIQQRGEYSVRLKSEQATKERESSSWPTPCARDHKDSGENVDYAKVAKKHKLSGVVQLWPTPDASIEKFRLSGNSQQSRSLEAMSRRGELSPPDLESSNLTGKNPARWPTPKANNPSSTRKPGTRGRELSQEAQNWATPEAQNQTGYQTKNGQVFPRLGSQTAGKLNPSWVEQLMDVPVLWTQLPTEWTDSDCLATELCQQQQQEHGQF